MLYTETRFEEGDVVTIYMDPLTERLEEGEAELVALLRGVDEGVSIWEVEFLDEPGMIVTRSIREGGPDHG